MKRTLVIEIVSLLFILLFTYAAVSKLSDVQKFTVQIGQSPLLTPIAGFAAWFIPIIEIVAALMLAFSRFRLLGLYFSFSLMVMFTLYIVAVLNFSERVPCACGGVLSELGWSEHLVFNIVFVLMALVGIFSHSMKENKNTVVA